MDDKVRPQDVVKNTSESRLRTQNLFVGCGSDASRTMKAKVGQEDQNYALTN